MLTNQLIIKKGHYYYFLLSLIVGDEKIFLGLKKTLLLDMILFKKFYFIFFEESDRLGLITAGLEAAVRGRPGKHARFLSSFLRCVDIKRGSSIIINPCPNSAYSSLCWRGDIGCFINN